MNDSIQVDSYPIFKHFFSRMLIQIMSPENMVQTSPDVRIRIGAPGLKLVLTFHTELPLSLGQARPARPKHSNHDIEDLSKIKVWTHGEIAEGDEENLFLPESTVHEQEDGTILACCATETSSKDSLLSWIRVLEQDVPNLKHMQILFTIKQAWSPIKPITEDELAMQPVK